MQGERVQAEVIAAMEKHLKKGVDAIVLTRGGGSRADLSWFDQRDLAVAIAECPVPVITAIGHEIDTSIADLVSHQSCKTPTAAAEFLVEIIDDQARRLDDAAERLLLLCRERLGEAQRRLEVGEKLKARVERLLLETRLRLQRRAAGLLRGTTARLNGAGRDLARLGHRLETTTGRRLMLADGRLRGAAPRLTLAADRALKNVRGDLERRQARLAREALRPLPGAARKLDTLAEKARLLDPTRLLARGYSMTTDGRGRLIKSSRDVAPGDTLLTRFADGQVRSLVQPGEGAGRSGKTPTKGNQRGSKQEEGGQESLF
jgi:exodeoxyribonuclease VII large subunit